MRFQSQCVISIISHNMRLIIYNFVMNLKNIFLFFLFIDFYINPLYCESSTIVPLKIKYIEMRSARIGDIGLYFGMNKIVQLFG